MNPNQPPVFDQQFIEKTLPHRYPFALVDKIIELSDTILSGSRMSLLMNGFFLGHFRAILSCRVCYKLKHWHNARYSCHQPERRREV
jgi:hypothetical protein